MSDRELVNTITRALADATGLSDAAIAVAVSSGAVVLTGTVKTRATLQTIERLVRRAVGTRSITNRIEIV